MGRYPPLLALVARAFEEFDAHFERIRLLTFDDELTLVDLGAIEVRMHGALGAVQAGGVRIRPLLEAALSEDDLSSAAAAAFAAHRLDPTWFASDVLERFPELSPTSQDGIRLALRQVPLDRLEGQLVELASKGEPFARACATDVLAFHRRFIPEGFEELLDHDDPVVRRLAIRAAGAWRDARWNWARLDREMAAGDEHVVGIAIEAGAWRQLRPLEEACRRRASAGGPSARIALQYLGVVGAHSDIMFLGNILKAAIHARDHSTAIGALEGLGALGYPDAIPILADALSDPNLFRAAGKAFLRLTGARDMEGDAPMPPPKGITGDDADFWDDSPAEVEAAKAERWWRQNAKRLEARTRIQFGRVMARTGWIADLDDLPTQIRRDEWIRRCYSNDKALPNIELERLPLLQT